MSLQIFIRGRTPIKNLVLLVSIAFTGFASASDWKIDFSRRKELQPSELPIQWEQKKEEPSFFDGLMNTRGQEAMDVVILNTETGFVPSQVRLLEGRNYRIHVVNVNQKDKNVSFVLDSFSEHHATYYGAVKTFTISPQKEGVYSFESPETSSRGRIIVQTPASVRPNAPEQQYELPVRSPASNP